MKNKVILLIVGLAMVALLAVATLFYEDLSAQFGADPITPTQQAPQEDQNTTSGEQEKQPVAAPDFTVEDANGNAVTPVYQLTVEAYAKNQIGGAYEAVAVAMMRYGDSVAAYAAG